MNADLKKTLLAATGAHEVVGSEVLQELWSGYGSIVRYGLAGAREPSIIVKHVRSPASNAHPRGWNTGRSHQRKIKSYQVEAAWYQNWSSLCQEDCYVPRCLAVAQRGDETILVLEDLSASGFDTVKTSVSLSEIRICLKWLAGFHATFLGQQPDQLWETGTYWHLGTRPDELEALEDEDLKNAADIIDQRLKASPFQTFVHGDAKLANFCFSSNGQQVAAVDFQYVGGGCGVKDLAYFIGSCLSEDDCQRLEGELLDDYFRALSASLHEKKRDVDMAALEGDWRELFPLAWTDFHRFIKGWSPGHWKINGYSEHIARRVVAGL